MKKNYPYRKKSEASGELSLLELQPSSKHDGKHGGKHAKQNYMMVMKGLRHFVANVYQKNNSLLFSDNLCLRTGNKREQLRYPSIKWTLTKQSLAIQRHCMFCSIAWINRHLNERQIFSVVDRPGKLLVYASEKNCAAPENQKNVGLAPLTMNLKNNSSKWPMAVQNVTVSDEFKKFIKVKKFTKKTLLAGEVLEVEFYVNKNLLAYGAYDAPLTVSYKSSTEPEIQEIQMPLRFMVVTPRNMKPKKIIPTEEEDFDEKRRVEIPGIKYLKVMSEKSVKERRVRNHLFDYPLPKPIRELYKIVKEQKGKEPIIPSDLQKELRKFENVLSAPLTASNYVEKFEAVLNLEEFHEEREIAKFNMWNVPLYNNQSSMRFRLIVGDGLAEGRPSLMQGDQVFIILSQEAVDNQRKPGSFNNRAAQGFTNKSGKKRGNGFYGTIKNVGRREVIIKCEDLVNGKRHHPNNKYHIQFSLNRYSYRLCYRALSLINNNILSILMPQGEYKKSFEKRTLEFFNKDIASNPEQVQAITNIVSRSCTPFPYVVFGPPGTGKTKTLVEAILQNWVVGKNQLVCASSNSAADVIVEEILKMAASNNDYLSNFEPDKNLLRLYSMSVEIASVSENILRHPIHNFEETNEAAYPPIADVLRIPIVVGTLATAARLSLQGIPANHFSHVFVDECGHCTEPECVLAVAGIIGKGGRSRAGDSTGVLETQLVLAGDPQQLGSTVQCKLSTMYQFGYSMLERLLKTTDMYQRDPRTGKYNPEVVTKLSRNYRSHRDIIDISNQLFYNGELVASGKPETLNSCSKIDFLPQKDHPVIFHGITGVEEQDDSSPSYFNMNEIDQVVAYISMLIDEANAKGLKYTLKDIGVVTPYKRQVKKLAQTFEDREWNEVAVGSVDLFQGSEKQIILISTVRASRTGKNASGKTAFGQQLDFINDAKRFNVALTRAKALLIVIGDPEILQFQSYWKLYMDYCLNKGTYMGALPASYKKVNELVKVKSNPTPKKSKTPKEKTPKKEKIVKSGMKTCGTPENGGGGDCVGVKSLEKSGGGDGPKRKSKVGKSESGGKGVEKTFRDLIMSVDIEEEIEELDRSMVTMKIKEERNGGGREDDGDVEDLEKSMERMTTKEEGKEEEEDEEEDALRKYFEKRMTIKEEGKEEEEEEEEEVLRKYFEERMTIKEEGEEENKNEMKMKKEGKKKIKEEKVGNETTRNENESIEESDDEEDDKIILKKEKQNNVKKENEKMLRSPLKEKEKLRNNNSESFKDKNSDVTEFEYNENWKSLKEVEMEKILRSISNLD